MLVIAFCTVLLVMGLIVALRKSSDSVPSEQTSVASNVRMADGVQIMALKAKGGYTPRTTQLKANTPTRLEVRTDGTFDCSLALSVPAAGYRANLPSTGITNIDIPPQKPGTTLQGTCSMGMYRFLMKFE